MPPRLKWTSVARCAIWACAWLVCASAPSAFALEFVEARWGFDGKVQRNQFNLVSVLVDNPRPEPFEGELRLRKFLNVSTNVDAPLVEEVYVGPFARRWVQFAPYVVNEWEQYRVQVRSTRGRGSAEWDLPTARPGWPARVFLQNSANLSLRGLPIRALPDVLFPPSVTGTDGLQALVIDSVPQWDEPRRLAFLNWLYRGGVAYVLVGENERFPDFPASFGPLADRRQPTRHGTGQIVWVNLTRSALNEDNVTEMFSNLPKRTYHDSRNELKEASPLDAEQISQSNMFSHRYSDGTDPYNSGSFLSRLKAMTKADHNWPLLHLLFWLYLGMVFPGCWLIGSRWSDYRLSYAVLLGSVVVFSLMFGVVGQRGYGESTAVHSVAIVRPLSDGTADVSQWTNIFVTGGGTYEIRHNGSGVLYSTCNIDEAVHGEIRGGPEAAFAVDIPPFSSREFAHRAQVPLKFPTFRVEDWSLRDDGGLATLKLAHDDPLPEGAEKIVVLYGNQFYRMSQQPGLLTSTQDLGQASTYLQLEENDHWRYRGWGGYDYGDRDRPIDDQYRDMFMPLFSRNLGVRGELDTEQLLLPPQTARLFFAARLPEALHIRGNALGRQAGWAIYAIDLRLTPR